MTRQWIRDWKLEIGSGGSFVDVSDFRFTFKVEQQDLQKPNSAEIMVTNLSKATMQKLKKEFDTVKLSAGYVGSSAQIFQGNIIQKRIGRYNPVDTYLGIVAQDGDKAYNFATVNKTLPAGSTFRQQVDLAAEAMKKHGVEVGHISDLGSQKMPSPRTFFGMARDLLRDVSFATKTSWSIQNGKLQILANKEVLPGSALVVNSRTGMVGMPIQTLDGIIVRTLLNPSARPGGLLKLDEGSVQEAAFSPNYTAELNNSLFPSVAEDGFYKILLVDHHGDSRGQPWYSDIICVRADGQGVQPIRLAQRGVDLTPGN